MRRRGHMMLVVGASCGNRRPNKERGQLLLATPASHRYNVYLLSVAVGRFFLPNHFHESFPWYRMFLSAVGCVWEHEIKKSFSFIQVHHFFRLHIKCLIVFYLLLYLFYHIQCRGQGIVPCIAEGNFGQFISGTEHTQSATRDLNLFLHQNTFFSIQNVASW